MPSLPLYNMAKKEVGKVTLAESVFGAEVKPHLISDAVRFQVARYYAWKTANCRTRTEVHGTRKKMYKQKGTGQARHGDAKAPIFVGGGKAHGPKPRLVVKKLNKKVRRAALISALSLHQKQDRLFVVESLETEKVSSQSAAKCLKSFGLETALIVSSGDSIGAQNFVKGAKNLPGVKVLKPEGVNVFDILKFKNILVTKSATERITERLTHA